MNPEEPGTEELDRKFRERKAEREQSDKEQIKSMEKHPRVALLPSPELLTVGSSSLGQDATDTLKDFDRVAVFMGEIKALNEEFYKLYRTKQLEQCQFGPLINLAFSTVFDAMRNTYSPKLAEYVIWYYTGHGHPKSTNDTGKSSMPKLDNVDHDVAKDKTVKGGELCLHHVGYCGLYGLIKQWIAGVKAKSINNSEDKENKHLIIILDSCYAGMIAQDLEELNKKEGPWNQNGCTITIQTACGPDEPTFGGYFTPCFLTLNKNQDLLDKLKDEWGKMEDAEKNFFSSLRMPSPKVVTTRVDSLHSEQNSATMEFSFNNGHKLTLFSNPGFFKFCSRSIFEQDENEELKKRVFNDETARDFMTKSNFDILDYKLKKTVNGPFVGHPLGLFLILEEEKSEFAVCAHVHFAKDDTSRVGRINLVHHLKPPRDSLLYLEDHDGLSATQLKKGKHKIPYAVGYWEWNKIQSAPNDEVIYGARLVKKCHDFVEQKEPGRWGDHSKWNMDQSYSGKFRQKERSEWMNKYMEKCDKS